VCVSLCVCVCVCVWGTYQIVVVVINLRLLLSNVQLFPRESPRITSTMVVNSFA